MFAQAARELFALINLGCGGLLFLFLLVYLARGRSRRVTVILSLVVFMMACILNSVAIYLLT